MKMNLLKKKDVKTRPLCPKVLIRWKRLCQAAPGFLQQGHIMV